VNFYSVLESGVIAVIGVFSVYQVVRLLLPRSVDRSRAFVVRWLARSPAGSWRQKLAARVNGVAPAGGCGMGCSSGCDRCGLATHVHPSWAGDDKS